MNIRLFKVSDTAALIQLFRNTVHTICRSEYSQDQLDAWAPKEIDKQRWTVRLTNSFCVIAETKEQVAGFGNLQDDGEIDMLYVAADFQAQGVGSQILQELKKEAIRRGFGKLWSDVSLTARSFFRSKGFIVEKEYSKVVGGVTFPNAIMSKTLD